MRFGRFSRLWKDESGQALVVATVSMAVLMGFLALAVDVGVLFHARRNVQLAADAAAVAAALDFKYNGNITRAQNAGTAAANANGISASGSNLLVHVPATNGPYAGDRGFAEVIIKQPMTTTFTNFLGVPNLSIAARAVAGPMSQEGCIWTLAQGAGEGISVNGSLGATNCNIYDNGPLAANSGSISASEIGITGALSGGATVHPNPPTTGMTPAANPLNLTAPTPQTTPCPGGGCMRSYGNGVSGTLAAGRYTSISAAGRGTLTLDPGNYTITNGLSITGTKHVTFGAGVYIVEGGLSLEPTGTGHIVADDVTFYATGGPTAISTASGGRLTITAPANGVALFEGDASATTITANTGMTFDGIVYAPAAPLTLNGSGGTLSTDLIAGSLSVGAGSNTITNYAAVTNTGSVLNRIRIVE